MGAVETKRGTPAPRRTIKAIVQHHLGKLDGGALPHVLAAEELAAERGSLIPFRDDCAKNLCAGAAWREA